jgi:hypothetical protein
MEERDVKHNRSIPTINAHPRSRLPDLRKAVTSIREGANGGASHKRGIDLPGRSSAPRSAGTGALSADVILTGPGPVFIDINPRLVEPGNARRSGVDLVSPMLEMALGGRPTPQLPGRSGVSTHELLLGVLGATQRRAQRRAVVRELIYSLRHRGDYANSSEELTPLRGDWRAAVPVAAAAGAVLGQPVPGEGLLRRRPQLRPHPAGWQQLIQGGGLGREPAPRHLRRARTRARRVCPVVTSDSGGCGRKVHAEAEEQCLSLEPQFDRKEAAMSGLLDHPPTEAEPGGPGGNEEARQQAIKQIERRRRFHIELVLSTLAMVLLVVIWAASEYHNAGGWPTQGFSQSSSIHDVWNYWIVYPLGAIVLFLGARAWFVYGHKPLSEDEITQEMERQSGRH